MFGKHKTDVLVVGAGPVGLFAALELARHGIEVEIIDGQWRTAAHSYALALHPGSLELLDRHGLSEELTQRGHRIDAIGFYDGGERRGEIRFSQLAGRFPRRGTSVGSPFALVLPQQALEDALEKQLAELGVEVHWNHRLAGLELGGKRAQARIRQLTKEDGGYGGGRVVEGRAVDTRARFVIGADGFHSVVRQSLDIDFGETGARQLFGVFEIDAAFDSAHEVRVVLEEKSVGVLWPMRGDHLRWSFELDDSWELVPRTRTKSRRIVQVGDDTFPYLSEDRLRQLLAARAPWFDAEIDDVTWSVAVRFEQRMASRFGRDNVWLAGDAAHVAAPMGVQSMNVGLREARVLADAIHTSLDRGPSPDLFETYGRERRREWRALLGLEAGVKTTGATAGWVRRRRNRIVPCIPASGAHLEQALGQIGLELG